MGRVYSALARAGRWNAPSARDVEASQESLPQGQPHYPATPPARVLGLRPAPIELEDFPAPRENHAPWPAPACELVPLGKLQGPFLTEQIRFKTFKIKPRNVDSRLPAIGLGNDAAREAYRTLAVRVSNIAASRSIKTIVVTSAAEGEGKTSTAANLAASAVRVGLSRVLLVEGDLRRPRLGERLGILARYGWSDLIEGRGNLMYSIAKIEPCGLHVLLNRSLSQPRQSDASEELVDLASSHRPAEVLDELKRHFDLIVIDSPCIRQYAEAQKLALIADGTILVVRAGCTHHRAVTEALKLVPNEKRIGIVLNESQA